MSSFDALQLLTPIASVFIVLAALATAALMVRRANVRANRGTECFRHMLAQLPTASTIIDENGCMHSFERELDPDSLWFPPVHAVGSILWDLPGTDSALGNELRATCRAAGRDGTSEFVCERADLNGIERRYRITCNALGRAHGRERLFHVLISDLTGEKTQELLLEQARKYYGGLLRNSPDAIVCVEFQRPGISPRWAVERQIDAFYEGTIAECNDAYARILGYRRREEIIGRRIRQLLPRTSMTDALVAAFVNNGYRLHGWDTPPHRDRVRDGEPMYHASWTAEFEDSHIVRSWTVFRDITDKLKAIDAAVLGVERRESLLLAEEAYFCYEHSPPIDTSLPLDEQAQRLMAGRLVECNAAYAKFCAADSPDAIIGMTLRELTLRSPTAHEEAPVMERLTRFIENDYVLEDARGEVTLPDGSKFISVLNCRGVLKQGHLTHHWAMLLDLSDREMKMHHLRSSEARFQRMANQSPALIYRLRLARKPEFEFVNNAIFAISGYSREQALIDDAVVDEVFSAHNLGILKAKIASRNPTPALTRHMHRSGSVVHLEHHIVPVRDSKGGANSIEGVALNVTERQDSQMRLQSALDEISKLKDELQRENVQLRDEIRSARGFDLIVGSSSGFKEVVALAARAAPTGSTILILGETGTGKELFARSIHKSSPRSDKPLISVNCAALPPTLIESELFGHRKGAFTGADSARIGRFEAADGGTLFLDEIGELSQDLQSKLLRVVEEGEFERIGDNKTVKVDVRFIAATNSDLTAAIERGEFRADLFYRLNVFPLLIPPLRDRADDVPMLANHFAVKHCYRLGKSFDSISPEFMSELMQHDWPGNVRELEAVIERSIIISGGGILQPVELASEHRKGQSAHATELTRTAENFERSLQEAERQHILRTLRERNWVIEGQDGAATRLGVAPSTLRSKMKKLGIQRPELTTDAAIDVKNRRLH